MRISWEPWGSFIDCTNRWRFIERHNIVWCKPSVSMVQEVYANRHSQHSCSTPLVMNAPKVPKATFAIFILPFPTIDSNLSGIMPDKGLAPTTMNILLNKACHLFPQKSANELEYIGLLDNRGHASLLNSSGLKYASRPDEGSMKREKEVRM